MKIRVSLMAGPLAMLVLFAANAGSALAGTPCDAWKGPAHGAWSNPTYWTLGEPGPTTPVCISTSGPVLIHGESVQAQSLTMSNSQELDIEASPTTSATLTLTVNSLIGAGSLVVLEADCNNPTACAGGLTSALTMSTGTLTNSGQIEAVQEHGNDTVSRQLNGNVTNTGTGVDASFTGNGINVQAPMEYGAQVLGATLDNQGTI